MHQIQNNAVIYLSITLFDKRNVVLINGTFIE